MKAKKIVSIIFVVVSLVICGVMAYSIYTDAQTQIAEWKATTWFGFTNNVDSFNEGEYVKKETIEAYEVKTDLYNSGVYYDALNEREQLVYKAFQYAFDNNYVYTYVDSSMLQEGDLEPYDIMVLLSLDSASVQQNLSSVEYTSKQTLCTTIYGIDVEKKVNGDIVGAETFSEKRAERVDKAVAELKKVDFKFTEATTEEEKAREIFRYVDNNVEYSSKAFSTNKTQKGEQANDVSGAEDFLYSAVFSGKTNCDGYANMFSLLCQMNGITCVEKVYYSEVEGEAGHTWNCVRIDGKWYNVDCTESLEEEESTEEDVEIREAVQFGCSDELQPFAHEYKEYAPVCKENLMHIDKTFSAAKGSGMASKIASCIRESDESRAIIVIKDYDKDDMSDTMQSVANNLRSDIRYIVDERDKSTICCIYKD